MLVIAPPSFLSCVIDLPKHRRLDNSWVYALTPRMASNAADQHATWDSTYPGCRGVSQSPINIRVDAAITSPALDSAFEPRLLPHVPLLVNNGVNVFELDLTTPTHFEQRSSGSTQPVATSASKGASRILNSSYRFYQVHWHTPSENFVDGKQFAMEAHFVHQLNQSSLVGTNERLAVIAMLYEQSEACNADLDIFWEALPLTPGTSPFAAQVDLQAMLDPLLPGGYFAWSGSLTTPPCTEGVEWILLKRRARVCARQLERLRRALAATRAGVDVNNRIIQPTGHRLVRMTTTPDALLVASSAGSGGRAVGVWASTGMGAGASMTAGEGRVLIRGGLAVLAVVMAASIVMWRRRWSVRRPVMPLGKVLRGREGSPLLGTVSPEP